MSSLHLIVAALLVALPAGAVDIEYVAVRDPGNAADTAANCFGPDCGSVPHDYAISKYEITNAEYAAFLGAVAVPDAPGGLYSASMDIAFLIQLPGGIVGYSATLGHEQDPVAFVSFWDALRFANWLHNGQPTGVQDATTTEDGAYTLTAAGVTENTITRNSGAQVFVASENEWYKAAYYDPTLAAGAGGYFDYPTGTDSPTTCSTPTAEISTANCDRVVGGFGGMTPVHSYPGSPSPHGTFDQGGNLREWNEQIESGSRRGVRGGDWELDASELAASETDSVLPQAETGDLGFRVARPVPEPSHVLLVLTGGLVLAAERRRRG